MSEIIWYVMGLAIGCFITRLITKPKRAGILRSYDNGDGDGPYFYLDLDLLPEEIANSRVVTFEVSRK